MIQMERLKFVCVFIVLSGFCQGATGEKPEMVPRKNEIIIKRYAELRITCCSEKATKLQFSYPETEFMMPRSNHKIFDFKNGTYTFLRKNMTLNDAGWYACAEEGVRIDNDFRNLNHSEEDVRWIYVYVYSTFFQRFASTSEYNFPTTVIVVAGSTMVVPCRPPSPTAKVKLWHNFKLADSDDIVRFDPKIGFVMRQVNFVTGEACLKCETEFQSVSYILRYSGPKPKMITPNHTELILQENDELRIECHSETNVSFMFPNIMNFNLSIQSKYNISVNNSLHTFLRSSVISEDTGWYGCAGKGIENNIPYYAINHTKKEINWIYVYVNSSVPVTQGLMAYNYANEYIVIPCRPTSPTGVHIRLNSSDPTILHRLENIPFDPKIGFVARLGDYYDFHDDHHLEPTFYCTTDKAGYYVPKNYRAGDTYRSISERYKHATIIDTDDSVVHGEPIIRMTGENLCVVCEIFHPDEILTHLEWQVPSTVAEARVQYNWTTDERFESSVHLRGKKLTITITNLTETDSGDYNCEADSDSLSYTIFGAALSLKIFDPNGGRYIKLGKQGGEMQVTGVEGGTVEWLVDLEYFPSAEIKWLDPSGNVVILNDFDRSQNEMDFIKRVSQKCFFMLDTLKEKAPRKWFSLTNLALSDRGVYDLCVNFGNGESSHINVTLNVQVPASVYLDHLEKYFYTQGEDVFVMYIAQGTPLPNVTCSFLKCPKFPSQEDAIAMELETSSIPGESYVRANLYFTITTSGILICEACNAVNCIVNRTRLLCSASRTPYFTSTNMNELTGVIANLKVDRNTTLVLECYASGRPDPNVTWFKKNGLKDDRLPHNSNQFRFAHGNRQLTILSFLDWDDGRYMCKAENKYGTAERYIDITVEDRYNLAEKSEQDVIRLSLIVAASVLLVVIVISWLVIWKLRTEARAKRLIESAFKNGAANHFNPELPVVDQADLLPYDLKWEYPKELLKLDKVLGSGAFGIVRKAEAKSICRGEPLTTVAVKLVRSTATLNYIKALSRELKILVYLGQHPNVVNLLGACTQNISYGELFVIVEFCRFGNLRDYLLRRRADFIDQIRSRLGGTSGTSVDTNQPNTTDETENHGTDSTSTSLTNDEEVSVVDSDKAHDLRSKYKGDYADLNLEEISTRDLVYWSWQVSRGMEYLGERKIVHGDLAARNVLLADNNIAKICDFGLSKALYEEAQYRDKGVDPLPVKWMAPESIKERVFSYQSDIWSFGILMWEFFTLGETPYPGIRNRELHQKLIDGHRMEQPKYANSIIYDTMIDCWKADPLERPSFTQLANILCDLLDEGFKTQYLEMTSTYIDIDANMFGNAKPDYSTSSPSAFNDASSSMVGKDIEMVQSTQDDSENPTSMECKIQSIGD